MGAAAAFTVLLAQHTTTAAFTAQTGDGGNSATTAATFCASPGSTQLTATSDTAVYQASPDTNYGSSPGIGIRSNSGSNAYSYVKFTLTSAPIPARCTVTSATLTIRTSSPTAGAIIEAYRANAAWNPATMTWNTGRVGFTGTPAPTDSRSTAGLQTWDVTTLTRELYAGTNNGFALKDSIDNAGYIRSQTWDSMEVGTPDNRPKLDVTWG
jgi:hypothetical protein